MVDAIKELIDTYPADWIISAVAEAVNGNARNMRYIQAILKRWKADGPYTNRRPNKAPALRRGGVDTSELDAIINGEIR